MIHSRQDYMRFQEPDRLLNVLKDVLKELKDAVGDNESEAVSRASKVIAKYDEYLSLRTTPIGEEEPVFLLRGKDRFIVATVGAYANSCRSYGLPHSEGVRNFVEHVRQWQQENSRQIPTVPEQYVLDLGL